MTRNQMWSDVFGGLEPWSLIRCNREDIPKMLEPVIAQMVEDTLKEEMNLSSAGAVSSRDQGRYLYHLSRRHGPYPGILPALKDYEPQLRRFKKMNLPK